MRKVYATILALTLGADDFDTREWWTNFLEKLPITHFIVVLGIAHQDADVAHRCRRITKIHNLPWLYWDDLHLSAGLSILTGRIEDAGKDAEWWGNDKHRYRADALEKVARELGVLKPSGSGEVVPYGFSGVKLWLTILRCRVAGKPCAADPDQDHVVPMLMPRKP